MLFLARRRPWLSSARPLPKLVRSASGAEFKAFAIRSKLQLEEKHSRVLNVLAKSFAASDRPVSNCFRPIPHPRSNFRQDIGGRGRLSTHTAKQLKAVKPLEDAWHRYIALATVRCASLSPVTY